MANKRKVIMFKIKHIFEIWELTQLQYIKLQ